MSTKQSEPNSQVVWGIVITAIIVIFASFYVMESQKKNRIRPIMTPLAEEASPAQGSENVESK